MKNLIRILFLFSSLDIYSSSFNVKEFFKELPISYISGTESLTLEDKIKIINNNFNKNTNDHIYVNSLNLEKNILEIRISGDSIYLKLISKKNGSFLGIVSRAIGRSRYEYDFLEIDKEKNITSISIENVGIKIPLYNDFLEKNALSTEENFKGTLFYLENKNIFISTLYDVASYSHYLSVEEILKFEKYYYYFYWDDAKEIFIKQKILVSELESILVKWS